VKIEGSYTISAPRDVVWEALNDPDVLSKTIPGGQDLEKTGENQYKAKMKIRVGPRCARFCKRRRQPKARGSGRRDSTAL
jgi:hypothetical protein